jgi:polyhydroxybutyrate depolymerase
MFVLVASMFGWWPGCVFTPTQDPAAAPAPAPAPAPSGEPMHSFPPVLGDDGKDPADVEGDDDDDDGIGKRGRRHQEPPADLVKIELEGEGIGGARSAWVRVPTAPGPWAVILAFHGGNFNTGLDMEGRFRKAEGHGILLVFPNGANVLPKGSGWTGPGKDDSPDPMRDVKFVRALLDELQKRYPIDPKRIFAAGISGGGFMTDLLWCEMSDRIAGFMVVARAMPEDMSRMCNPARPRPMVLMLGTADEKVSDTEHQLPVPQTLQFIREKLGCKDAHDVDTLPDKGDPLVVNRTRWTKCSQGAAFEYFEIVGGGHQWPGSGRPRPDKALDVDATEEMLGWLRTHAGL